MVQAEVLRLLLLFAICIGQSVAETMRSFTMSIKNERQFTCANTTCLPFAAFTISKARRCQLVCINDEKCQAISFHHSTTYCELFANIWNQKNNLSINRNVITMIMMTDSRTSSSSG